MDLSSDEEVLVLVAVAEDEDRNRSVESYFIKEKKINKIVNLTGKKESGFMISILTDIRMENFTH